MYTSGEATFAYPIQGWGYEEVGRVAEVDAGVTLVRAEDVIWGTSGHRSTAVVDEERAAACVLPDGVAPLAGAFAHIGAIALNAVLDADIHVGETVAIFGLGVPGQIA